MFRDHRPGTRTAYPFDGNENTAANASAPPAAVERAKQPTYTTVGSIYNPQAAAPLQPPTRRPRTRRYPPTIQSPTGESFLGIPNSLLSVLPMKDRVQVSPPPPVKPAPHYSPLQQNYDRAISPPPEEDDIFLTEVGMAVPSIRSGNLPPANPGISSRTGVKQSGTPFRDSDSAVSEDAILPSRYTVKGLTSLASFPNPGQKAAQYQLARARTANMTIKRLASPLPIYPAKERAMMSSGGAPTGTPKPLTAGPPGQRQFRPSTFEGTVRALGLDENPPPPALISDVDDRHNFVPVESYATSLARLYHDDHLGHIMDRNTNEVYSPGGTEEQGPDSEGPWTGTFSDSLYTDRITAVDVATCQLSPASYKAAERRFPYDTEPLRSISQYFPRERPRDLGKKIKDRSHSTFGMYAIKPEETAAERRARINRNFYAGTEGLGKTLKQVAREHDNLCLKNTIGVIGGERDRARASDNDRAAGWNDVIPLPHLSVEQANNTHDSLHAEPLVNMAFATLVRNKEEMNEASKFNTHGFTGNFIPCDPAWVDDSIGGNKSFFEKRDDDALNREEFFKKRRTIKRPRVGRGY
ncbi:pyrimidine-specific ribonucleoside hydrolase RihA [Podospora aff. communis PSN243]|uniref:Pyrimidine-specific ribonucleoside hydrolase RihA n=1 Tax=Podospora aff. communis PSN243 TaxID=3040156 RepID=A0AAV9GX89_9PEZI|nr:pyrimidine-specific ribonucleoside hydrolase RihA [Podospora aff. communis PSN243]